MTRTLLLHGQFHTLSSFSLVNRQLAIGLRAWGYQVTVMPSDGTEPVGPPVDLPDIYLVHDHPYDVLNAPGRLNAFLLEYEYARILHRDKLLVERLNHFFDLLIAPSHFVQTVCQTSGVRIPIVVCPLGVDRSEFHPNVLPAALPTNKTFKFLYVGGANERKGTDILLSAFTQEFTAQDDAVLAFKTFGYEDHLAAFERAIAKLQRRRNAPEIVHLHGKMDSVAGYYTAADWGVFPTRGEGFGLPVLECLACGRPALVTDGTAPTEFCASENARLIPARWVTRRGKLQREPNLTELQKLLRAAFEGKLLSTSPDKISASVSKWTWERTVNDIHNALQWTWPRRAVTCSGSAARVGYTFYQRGVTSWKKVAHHIDRALARHFDYVPLDFHAAPPKQPLQVLIGESGFALEHFLRAARVNQVKRILTRGNGPQANLIAIENRERALCGVPPRHYSSMERWRNRRECALADQILVWGRGSQKLYVEAGYSSSKVRTLLLGVDTQPRPARRRGRTLRFLFLGTNPFRKGIRILFQAWDALQPKNAELVCIASNEILQSPLLLRYLVRNPSILFKPLVPHHQVKQEYLQCDCQVLPSFEDGFPLAVGEGMGFGKPAIVSEDTGVSDLISQKENGLVVPQGSVQALSRAIEYLCDNHRDIPRMGQAAFETVRPYTWARFEQELVDIVQAQLTHA
jgi:glycosyltransferase involved in cell wall biosynthesis